jgi:hypothetical protein
MTVQNVRNPSEGFPGTQLLGRRISDIFIMECRKTLGRRPRKEFAVSIRNQVALKPAVADSWL